MTKTKEVKDVLTENEKRPDNKFLYKVFIIALMGVLFYGVIMAFNIYSKEDALQMTAVSTNNVAQGDEIVLNFSTAVDGRFNLHNVKIEPALKVKADLVNNKQLRVKILGVPNPNQEYKISLGNIKTFWLNLRTNLSANFQSIKTPTVVEVYPNDKQTEVAYDSKIKIDLGKALDDRLLLKIDIKPEVETTIEFNKQKTGIVIIPKKELDPEQEYTLNVNVEYRDDKNFKSNLYTGKFVTKIPPKVVYNINKDGTSEKTENITWEITPKISKGRYVDIDLTHQVMSIFEDGSRKASYKVSTGKRSMKTPTGTFHVLSKRRRPWSAHYGLYMPWFMGFTRMGHGIHELPEWPSGYKEGANHLGIPVSHGCVRLGVGPAKIVYDFSSKGTPIVVHY